MKSRPPPARRPFQPHTRLGEDLSEGVMIAPARLLDPLRVVDGTRNGRYDCPDVAALDRHLDRLRRRIADLAGRSPGAADDYRADIDRLLDRRTWLTLPVHRVAEPTG